MNFQYSIIKSPEVNPRGSVESYHHHRYPHFHNAFLITVSHLCIFNFPRDDSSFRNLFSARICHHGKRRVHPFLANYPPGVIYAHKRFTVDVVCGWVVPGKIWPSDSLSTTTKHKNTLPGNMPSHAATSGEDRSLQGNICPFAASPPFRSVRWLSSGSFNS